MGRGNWKIVIFSDATGPRSRQCIRAKPSNVLGRNIFETFFAFLLGIDTPLSYVMQVGFLSFLLSCARIPARMGTSKDCHGQFFFSFLFCSFSIFKESGGWWQSFALQYQFSHQYWTSLAWGSCVCMCRERCSFFCHELGQ